MPSHAYDRHTEEATVSNIIVWADIPVTDLARASAFYAAVMQREVALMPGRDDIALIQGTAEEGRIVSADLYVGGAPSHDGPTIYLHAGGDIKAAVARAVAAGGKVLQDAQNMGEMVGWIAFIEDTEGNRIGLQQP